MIPELAEWADEVVASSRPHIEGTSLSSVEDTLVGWDVNFSNGTVIKIACQGTFQPDIQPFLYVSESDLPLSIVDLQSTDEGIALYDDQGKILEFAFSDEFHGTTDFALYFCEEK